MSLYRIGDLVKYTDGYINGVSNDLYCKVISIKDYDGNSHDEYNIIKGRGDKNSKVTLDIKAIAVCKTLKPIDKTFNNVNPHNVFNYYDIWLEETENKINFLIRKKEFLLKNKNRIDKLDELLE